MNPSLEMHVYDFTSTTAIELCRSSTFRDKLVIRSQLKPIMDYGET